VEYVFGGHPMHHASHQTPKWYSHGKSDEYIKKVRSATGQDYLDRFTEQYNKIHNTSNGYFSQDGVPYHSVETLMVEAPDYGHETTSEAFSYYIWLEAANIYVSGSVDGFNTAWDLNEKYLIPTTTWQPTDTSYNPESPAEYAPEEDSPADYPVPISTNVQVGVDPLADELATAYGNGNSIQQFYATHWLLDVDNIYGFGEKESGNANDRNVFINTFQRGPNESVWRTIPQPEWETFKYGDSQCGFLDLFIDDPNGCSQQWRYTGAPDADSRSIQATYWAIQYAQSSGSDISSSTSRAQKLGDFLRYSMWDKYFKTIPCYSENCPATSWSDSWNSTFYLISWYYAWGGNIGSYDWSWRIGASHIHQGYQNIMTAYAILNQAELNSKTSSGLDQWKTVEDRNLEFWQWLQTAEGAIAGGATNSWDGDYSNPAQDGITGYFYEMPYVEAPVYHCPPSNNWFGMQVWPMERLAEYYYVSKDSFARSILKNWITWVLSLSTQIINGNDFQVPSTLNWQGQPDNWTGTYTGNPNLHVTIIDWSQDAGVASELAHTLTFWAAAEGDDNAQTLAKNILDMLYLHVDDVGVSIPEARQDYIGNEYGDGFWESAYVPQGWGPGTYPNGDTITYGDQFIDIRSWYTNDPMWPYVQECKANNTAPVFTYHRMWAQAAFAIANADYGRLFPN